nr:hypothetical protein [Tanacetum cinerariifolium]
NDEGKIIEKSFLELKGTFLVKIHDNDFSGTNGEDAVEHIENFLKVVSPLKIPNVSNDRFRRSVFHNSLTDATSEWFKKECIGSLTTWEDVTEKIFGMFYLPSRTNKEIKADEDEVSHDQAKFRNWLASKFKNYMTMDQNTIDALWKYLRMGSDEEVTNDDEPCNDMKEYSKEVNEVAKIFRIETDIFDYESPVCKAFNEFNYPF